MVNIGNDWDAILKPVFETDSYQRLRAFLANEYRTATVYPNMYDIFGCLHGTAYKDVKVVMCRNLTRKGKTSLVYRWLYKQLDCIVFDSQLAMDEFLSTNPPIDRDKLRVIFNAIIVPDNLQAMNLRAEFGIAQDETIILCHGRLDPEKGQHVLIEAVAKLKGEKFKLVLVGGGSEEYTLRLKALIQRHELEQTVIMAGFVDSVISYVAGGEIGVLPSIVAEGCSLAAQEHMAQGHPIVATNNGGQREYIVDGKNGLLVPPNDPDALADALRKLLHLNYESYYRRMREIY